MTTPADAASRVLSFIFPSGVPPVRTRKSWLHRKLDDWLLRQRIAELDAEERGQVIVDDNHDLYLVRVYLLRVLRHRLPGVFIHRFFRSDHDRALHNHPWKWAVALVLTNGYVEERMEGIGAPVTRKNHGRLSVNVITARTYHRVQLYNEEQGTWTLFIAGPKVGRWGFIDPDTCEYEDFEARAERLAAGARLRALEEQEGSAT